MPFCPCLGLADLSLTQTLGQKPAISGAAVKAPDPQLGLAAGGTEFQL